VVFGRVAVGRSNQHMHRRDTGEPGREIHGRCTGDAQEMHRRCTGDAQESLPVGRREGAHMPWPLVDTALDAATAPSPTVPGQRF